MTPATRIDAIQLSPVELLACWEALCLPDPPSPLRMRRPGGTHAARRETRAQLAAAMRELAGRGLSDGVLPAPVLVDALHVLGDATRVLDIRFTGPAGRPAVGLGASVGAQVVVVRTNDGLGPIDVQVAGALDVPRTLVGLLGPVEAGIGYPVNIPCEVLDAACAATRDGSVWSLADQLHARGVPRRDAASLARMCTGIDCGGQLGVTVRDGGAERRGPWVVGFVRARDRYFGQLRRGGTLSVRPIDAAGLARQWHELVEHTR